MLAALSSAPRLLASVVPLLTTAALATSLNAATATGAGGATFASATSASGVPGEVFALASSASALATTLSLAFTFAFPLAALPVLSGESSMAVISTSLGCAEEGAAAWNGLHLPARASTLSSAKAATSRNAIFGNGPPGPRTRCRCLLVRGEAAERARHERVEIGLGHVALGTEVGSRLRLEAAHGAERQVRVEPRLLVWRDRSP